MEVNTKRPLEPMFVIGRLLPMIIAIDPKATEFKPKTANPNGLQKK
jgi:hypothetical protein